MNKLLKIGILLGTLLLAAGCYVTSGHPHQGGRPGPHQRVEVVAPHVEVAVPRVEVVVPSVEVVVPGVVIAPSPHRERR